MHKRADNPTYLVIFVNTCKGLSMGAVGEHGDEDAVVSLGRKMHFHGAVFEAAVDQREAAGSMVRRHDDEGLSVLLGPLQDLADVRSKSKSSSAM